MAALDEAVDSQSLDAMAIDASDGTTIDAQGADERSRDGDMMDMLASDSPDLSTPADDVARPDIAAPSDVSSDVSIDALTPSDLGCDATGGECPRDASTSRESAVTSDVASGMPSQRSCPSGSSTPGCGMALVPGGTFTMGESPDGGFMSRGAQPEQPSITVDAFWMDVYEVTVARFRAYWNAGHPAPSSTVPYPSPDGGSVGWPWSGAVREPCVRSGGSCSGGTSATEFCNWTVGASTREGHPINCIDWATAQAFCVWDGGRLATEAEWEYAARGADGRPLPWGWTTDLNRICGAIYSGSTRSETCLEEDPQFSSGRSPFDVRHMVGNVWEWTADFGVDYTNARCWNRVARRNPLCDDGAEDNRVIRGGSWSNGDGESLRCSARIPFASSDRNYNFGVRCVRSRSR